MKHFSLGVLSVSLIFLTLACSPTQKITADASSGSSSVYPGWYNNSEFVSDSLSFHGFATAIATDSVIAVERAVQQARLHLEENIGNITEDIREEMVDAGSTDADNTDFIIILRTAHSTIGGESTIEESSASSSGDFYRGFAAVSLSKSAAGDLLEKGFTGHPRYWGGFSSASSFSLYFE